MTSSVMMSLRHFIIILLVGMWLVISYILYEIWLEWFRIYLPRDHCRPQFDVCPVSGEFLWATIWSPEEICFCALLLELRFVHLQYSNNTIYWSIISQKHSRTIITYYSFTFKCDSISKVLRNKFLRKIFATKN